MDVDKIPQNKNNLHNGTYKTIVYAVDESGKYVAAQTSGWEPEDIAHEQAWEDINKIIEDTRQEVLAGKLSPIAYFMEKSIMTPTRLSGMVDFSKRKIKKHMKPKGFAKLTKEQLAEYADALEITVDDLINFR